MKQSEETKLRINVKTKQLEEIKSNLQDYIELGSESPTIKTEEGRKAASQVAAQLESDIEFLKGNFLSA